MIEAIVTASPERVPLLAVGLTQASRAGGRPAGDPIKSTIELWLALELVGFSAEFVATSLTVFSERSTDESETGIVHSPHHVVWVESFRRMIDPGVPHLPVFQNAGGAVSMSPVIMPLSHPDRLDQPLGVPRHTYLLAYSRPDKAYPQAITQLVPADQYAAASFSALFLALETVIALGTAEAVRGEAISARHPQLADLVSPIATRLGSPPVADESGPRYACLGGIDAFGRVDEKELTDDSPDSLQCAAAYAM